MSDTLTTAALLAADLAATVDRDEQLGFQLRDVRFFHLLFRNWLELDLREPGADIDLTQLRRACERLAAQRRIRVLPRSRRRGRTPRARYVLTLAGVLALVDELVAWHPKRTFEETLFVVLFAASYRSLVVRRADQAGAPVARKRLARVLDVRTVVGGMRRALARQATDIERRIAGGNQLLATTTAARAAGSSDTEIARMLERVAPYQLNYVRPLGDLLLSLSGALRRYEMTEGIVARRDLVFAPMLRHTRAQQALLGDLESIAVSISHQNL